MFSFIGELYKEQIFTVKHIVFCIVHLIRKESEESIEYLCNLLKIIGKKVEEVRIYAFETNILYFNFIMTLSLFRCMLVYTPVQMFKLHSSLLIFNSAFLIHVYNILKTHY